MLSKMAVRQHILSNCGKPEVRDMLTFSLWGPEIFPEEAFEFLKNRYPGKTFESLLGINPKMLEDLQASQASGASGSNAFEPAQKKQKFTQQISKTPSSQNKQGWNRRGSRGGKKNQRGNKNKNSGNGRQNQARHNQIRNNNPGKPFQKGKKRVK